MDFWGEYQQVVLPQIGTNMKKGCLWDVILVILFLGAFNVILEYVSRAGLPR